MLTVIAVTQRVSRNERYVESRDCLDQRLNEWLLEAGYLPIPVPNNLGHQISSWLSVVKPNGILLSGGEDVGACPERDATEKQLLNHANKNHLPVLGICRGIQMLSVYFGGKLKKLSGHVSKIHPIKGELVEKNKLPSMVNSFHNWTLETCPDPYVVTATDSMGNIEAIKHTKLSWEGWMWHPEREPVFRDVELSRARKIFSGV